MNRLISNSIHSNANCDGLNNNIRCFRQAICTVTCCLLFSGCASFSDRPIRRHKVNLDKDEISRISGTYQLFPDLTYTKSGFAETLRYQHATEHCHRYVSKREIDFKPSENLTVDIKVIGNDQISFHFKKDSLVIDRVTLSARLQSRGLLLLGNKYVEFHGVPYILGGSKSEKTRIGLASDGGLIVNHAYDSSGAFLLFIGAGRGYDTAYHFKRIK